MVGVFVRVWEYEVAPGQVDPFVAAYGPVGEWARLFQRGEGYAGTELYRDTASPDRFLTVDRWADEHAWRRFLDRWREPYETLDAALQQLTAVDQRLHEGDV